MLKKISIIVSIALSICLICGLWKVYQDNNVQSKYYESVDKQARPLRVQINDLEKEMKNLEDEYSQKMKGIATEQILFTELDEELYTEVYPMMEDIPGVLALSQSEIFGQNGKITRTQFNQLLHAGWSYCLSWDGDGELSTWLADMAEQLRTSGLEMPATVYFSDGSYSSDAKEILIQYGVTTVVHHGEESQALMITDDDTDDGDVDIWYPGAVAWNYSGVTTDIDTLVEQGGNLVFTVSFRQERDMWKEISFQNMLDYISDYIQSEKLIVTDFPSARARHTGENAQESGLSAELEQKKAELQEEIDALQRQIDELYDQ